MSGNYLMDKFGRRINYLRLAVTDRCNLRCFYCMPENGIQYVPKAELLTYEEMIRLTRLLVPMGIEKVRITGGEPFVRKGMMDFLKRLTTLQGIKKVNVTTNGTLTAPLVPDLKKIGIASVNLSLDALSSDRFFEITRRNNFDKVMETFESLLTHGITTKINAVVMKGKNIEEIIPMVALTKDHPVAIRFIEEMPFNGSGSTYQRLEWDHKKIFDHIKSHFPDIEKILDPPNSTAQNFRVPGFKGSIGIIAAWSRTFCGACNRVRLTPKGTIRTCLYDSGIFNIKDIMRAGATDEQIQNTFVEAVKNKVEDGFAAEKNKKNRSPISESMSTIGG